MEYALPIVITALVLVVMVIAIRKAVHQDVPLRWLLIPGGIEEYDQEQAIERYDAMLRSQGLGHLIDE